NTHMMEECYQMTWTSSSSEALESSAKESNQVPTETLGSVEFSQMLPQVNLLAGEGPLIDTQLGSCMQARPSEQQGTGRDGDKVTEVQPGSSLTVTTASGVYGPESLVITAGPWANTLVSNTGLQLPQQLGLLNLSASGTYGISRFVQMGEEGAVYHFYGLLSNECPGLMKVRNTERVRQTDRTDILFLSQFVSLYLSGLEPEPALVESCLYTVRLLMTSKGPQHYFREGKKGWCSTLSTPTSPGYGLNNNQVYIQPFNASKAELPETCGETAFFLAPHTTFKAKAPISPVTSQHIFAFQYNIYLLCRSLPLKTIEDYT
uniref:FAD dependent oxidoreductase domain-containing protein n=1 Tax=Oncorhynchus kisutch TaxID=8019 RepID=A0A8C7N571_ONCKI